MSFLFPLAWWLGLCSLPVIGFYLLKTRQRRRTVSTLLFWTQLKPKIENSPFWRKLRRWLSLALQLLILTLVIMALARPAFDWERKKPRQVVVLLDNSASMQAGKAPSSQWRSSVDRLQMAIARLRILDEMSILTTEEPPRLVSGWTTNKRALRDSLASVPQLKTGTDPGAAFLLARELTAMRPNSEVEIFSDGVWPQTTDISMVKNWKITGSDSFTPKNTGITLFAVRRSPVGLGDWQIDVEVTSLTPFSGQLKLLRDGQPMDLVMVECAAGKPWRKTWQGSSETKAEFTAELQAAADDLLKADDTAHCSLAALRRLHVFLAGASNTSLETVLSSIPLVEWRRTETFPVPVEKEVDLIIASENALPEKAPTTPLLLINPVKSGFWGEKTGTLQDVPVTDVETDSPLLRYTSLSSVAIQEAGQWTPPPGGEVYASSLGHPLLFGQWDRQPRVMVIGFNFEKSDLPLRTSYPIFIGNLLQSLRDDSETSRAAAALPGVVESQLQPRIPPQAAAVSESRWPVFPGWWLVLMAALLLLVAEWFFYNRRITD